METQTAAHGARGLDKTRLGRCYQLAGEYTLEQAHCELVHGTIQQEPHPPNPHAWCEFEDGDGWLVWEPIGQDILPRAVFYTLFNAEEHNRYTPEVQFSWMEKTRNWGPWEGDYWNVDGDKAVKGAGR
ncbi:hypothetical protein LCGC14_2454770 [marine sediment metagenome]|uniref:Transglutaminase-like domain-containing protein n=1 Tax=marine sediment metagenome TaxID=412755 RepID=A0A0F9BF01_9ZZZZ